MSQTFTFSFLIIDIENGNYKPPIISVVYVREMKHWSDDPCIKKRPWSSRDWCCIFLCFKLKMCKACIVKFFIPWSNEFLLLAD